jgi:hypothetical protein
MSSTGRARRGGPPALSPIDVQRGRAEEARAAKLGEGKRIKVAEQNNDRIADTVEGIKHFLEGNPRDVEAAVDALIRTMVSVHTHSFASQVDFHVHDMAEARYKQAIVSGNKQPLEPAPSDLRFNQIQDLIDTNPVEAAKHAAVDFIRSKDADVRGLLQDALRAVAEQYRLDANRASA